MAAERTAWHAQRRACCRSPASPALQDSFRYRQEPSGRSSMCRGRARIAGSSVDNRRRPIRGSNAQNTDHQEIPTLRNGRREACRRSRVKLGEQVIFPDLVGMKRRIVVTGSAAGAVAERVAAAAPVVGAGRLQLHVTGGRARRTGRRSHGWRASSGADGGGVPDGRGSDGSAGKARRDCWRRCWQRHDQDARRQDRRA